MASTGKAFCSVACGIMLDEHRESIPEGLDTKVFTPQYLPARDFDNLAIPSHFRLWILGVFVPGMTRSQVHLMPRMSLPTVDTRRIRAGDDT